MGNKFFLATFLSIFIFTTQAQRTQFYEHQSQQYENALDLFERKQFEQAAFAFEQIEKSDNTLVLKNDAHLMNLVCQVILDRNGADQRLEDALDNEPAQNLSPVAYLYLSRYYFDQNKYRKAYKLFEKIDESVISKDERDEMNFKMGYAYLNQREYEKAKEYFDAITNTQSPYFVRKTYYLGYICYATGNYDCALDYFNKVGSEAPERMQLQQAQIYYAKEDYEKSLSYLQNYNEDGMQFYSNLLKGKIHYQKDEYSKAYQSFKNLDFRLRKMEDEDIYQVAFVFQRNGDLDRAIDLYKRISTAESALSQSVNYGLGQIFLDKNDKSSAYDAFLNAKTLDFSAEMKEESSFYSAKLAYDLGYQNIAFNALQDFEKNYPSSSHTDEVRSLMADLLLKSKNYKKAIEVFESMNYLSAESKKAYQEITFYRGQELLINKQYSEAESMFEKSQKYPSNKELFALSDFWIGEIAYQNKNLNVAINKFNRFLNYSASSNTEEYRKAYYNLGYCYYDKEDFGKAANYFSQYEKSAGNSDQLAEDNTLRLADCYFLTRNYQKAISTYDKVIKRNENYQDYAIFQKGMLYGLLGDNKSKIRTLRIIEQKFRKSYYADDALFEIAATHMEMNQFSTAESFYNLIISQYNNSPFVAQCYLQLGLIYYRNNDDNRAIAYYKQVVEKFPKTEESSQALMFLESIYTRNGRADEYVEYVQSVPGANIRLTRSDSILYESAMVKYRAGDCATAQRNFKKYISTFGNKGYFIVPVNYYLAECLFYNDKELESLINYEYVAKAGRSEFQEKSLIRLTSEYYRKEEYANALEFYEKLEPLATEKGTFINAKIGLARCYYLLQNYDNAKLKASDLLALDNVSEDIQQEANYYLGKIQFDAESYRTAKFHFDFVRKGTLNAMSAEAQYYYALLAYKDGKLDEAKDEALDINRNYSSYEYWVVKGFILVSDVYRDKKNFFQAKATLNSIIENYSGDQTIINECKIKLKELEELESEQDSLRE